MPNAFGYIFYITMGTQRKPGMLFRGFRAHPCCCCTITKSCFLFFCAHFGNKQQATQTCQRCSEFEIHFTASFGDSQVCMACTFWEDSAIWFGLKMHRNLNKICNLLDIYRDIHHGHFLSRAASKVHRVFSVITQTGFSLKSFFINSSAAACFCL